VKPKLSAWFHDNTKTDVVTRVSLVDNPWFNLHYTVHVTKLHGLSAGGGTFRGWCV
jgi:hypothetical protein